MSPASSSLVQFEAISYTNVAINYNHAGCIKQCELRIASSNASCALHQSIPHPLRVSLTRGGTGYESIQQFSCAAISNTNVAINYNPAECNKHFGMRIPHPFHVSLTRGTTSHESIHQLSCAVSSYPLHKRSHS